MADVVQRLRSYILDGRGTSSWSKLRAFGKDPMNGCVTGCGYPDQALKRGTTMYLGTDEAWGDAIGSETGGGEQPPLVAQ
jgi:hypothetical protein